jgi:hypothetical protein
VLLTLLLYYHHCPQIGKWIFKLFYDKLKKAICPWLFTINYGFSYCRRLLQLCDREHYFRRRLLDDPVSQTDDRASQFL